MRRSAAPPPGSATDQVYRFAKWAILNAVFSPGEAITEKRLAREIGVSRTPARTALLRLEAEGLVRPDGRNRTVVATFTISEVEDVLDARVLVENHTASRAFEHRKEMLPGIEEAHEALKQSRLEQNVAGFTDYDRIFHELIVDAAGNSVLSSVYRMLRERQTLFTSVMVRGRVDRMDAAVTEHERILDTLRGDDVEAFCTSVNEHLTWSITLARESLSV